MASCMCVCVCAGQRAARVRGHGHVDDADGLPSAGPHSVRCGQTDAEAFPPGQ